MTKDEEAALKNAPQDWINGPEWSDASLSDFLAQLLIEANRSRYADLIHDEQTEARAFPQKPSIHDN